MKNGPSLQLKKLLIILALQGAGATIKLIPPLQHSYVVEGVLILFSHPVRLKLVTIQGRRRLLKFGPSVYVVKCRFSMNSLSVPFGRRSLWTPPMYIRSRTVPKACFSGKTPEQFFSPHAPYLELYNCCGHLSSYNIAGSNTGRKYSACVRLPVMLYEDR